MRIDLRRDSEQIESPDRDEVRDSTGFFPRDERAADEFLIDFVSDPVNLSALRRGLTAGRSRLSPAPAGSRRAHA
jgi:hypothetical protein